jgi:hypothetical protein
MTKKITHPAIRSRHEKLVHEMEGLLIDITHARFGTTIDKNTIERSVRKMQELLDELRVENEKLQESAMRVLIMEHHLGEIRKERDDMQHLMLKTNNELCTEIAELKRRQGALL